MRHLLLCLAVVVGLGATGGCTLLTAPEDPGQQLAKARARWEATGIQNYTITQTRTCECLPPSHYTLVVRDGAVSEVVYDRQAHWTMVSGPEGFLSVGGVFELLERVLHRHPAYWKVIYHPAYGYPTEIFIDIDARTVDDEIVMTMADLVALND